MNQTAAAELTLAHFRERVGETFQLTHDGERYTLELTEATAVGPGRDDPEPPARPFSLLFRGRMPQLPQQTHLLENEHLGELALFLVPLGLEDGVLTLEACFC